MINKGSTVISENILTGFTMVISFILIVLVVRLVLTYQSERVYENIFESIARDIATTIDRQTSMSGEEKKEYELPKGVHADLRIDYKYVFVKYDDKIIRKSFSGLTNSHVYEFNDPRILCFIKEGSVIEIFDRKCDQVV
jgi:hypothetical protein